MPTDNPTRPTMPIFPHNSITKTSTCEIQGSNSTLPAQRPLRNLLQRHGRSYPPTPQHTITYYILLMSRLQISHRLPPIPFALNMRRKLRLQYSHTNSNVSATRLTTSMVTIPSIALRITKRAHTT